jgi:histidinol-phosphate aminotransferase
MFNQKNIMYNTFFAHALQQAEYRITPTGKQVVKFYLDKNEQPADVDTAFKKRVLEHLLQADWNRYPAIDLKDIEEKVAEYCGLLPENIVLSAGSAGIITTLLNHFALHHKHIVIAQPSYTLFDYHCKTNNISYEPWFLDADLGYNVQTLPALRSDSVLIITSPNNPAGNTLCLEKLEHLLVQYPQSCIILDGVYTEFSQTDPTPLVKRYPNLIVLRSFSKAFPMAGLRLGYLCASPTTAAIVKKLVLPFSINHFSLAFAREMLHDRAFMASAKQRVQRIVAERERMCCLIGKHFSPGVLKVFRSEGNFLLIRVFDNAAFSRLMEDLPQNGIKVLNTSGAPLLHNTLRVSIGTPYENEVFFSRLRSSLERTARHCGKNIPPLFPVQPLRHSGMVRKPVFGREALCVG